MGETKIKSKNVLLLGSIGRGNLGDDVICLSLSNFLRKKMAPNDSIYIFSKTKSFFQNFENADGKIHAVTSFSMLFKAFLTSDCLILGGGDYIGDFGRVSQRIRTFLIFFSLGFITKMFSKKFSMLNSSFTVTSRNGLAVLNIILNLTDYVSVRDGRSLDLLLKYSQKKPVRGFDTAVLLYDNTNRIRSVAPKRITNIGFSITPNFSNPFLTSEDIKQLAQSLAKDIDKLLFAFEDVNIFFLVFNTSVSKDGDSVLINDVMNSIDSRQLKKIHVVYYDGCITDFMSQFHELDAVVCFKYHSAIFSYSFGKPMIVIGYHPKNEGLVKDIGLSDRAFLSFHQVLAGKIFNTLVELMATPEQFMATYPLFEARQSALNGLSCLQIHPKNMKNLLSE